MLGSFPLLNVVYNYCFKNRKGGSYSEQMSTVNILVIP